MNYPTVKASPRAGLSKASKEAPALSREEAAKTLSSLVDFTKNADAMDAQIASGALPGASKAARCKPGICGMALRKGELTCAFHKAPHLFAAIGIEADEVYSGSPALAGILKGLKP